MDIPKSALKQIIIMKKEESFFVGREAQKVIMKNMEFNGNYSLVVEGVEKAGLDVRTAFETVHGKAQNVLYVNIGSYGDSKSSVAARFYVEEMLGNGMSPDDCVERIIHHIKTNSGKNVVEGIGNIIESPEEILRRAKIVLRPASERYDTVVKKEGIFENTCLLVAVAADENDGGVSTCFMPQYLLKKHGLTEASLWDAAYKNTREELRLATMAEDLPKEMLNGCFDEEDDILNRPPYVVRTKNGINGAACIMLPDIKEPIRERFGGGRYFVIPSSIHECLLFPDDGMVTEEYLNIMVSEVNENEVDASEFLASSVAILDI